MRLYGEIDGIDIFVKDDTVGSVQRKSIKFDDVLELEVIKEDDSQSIVPVGAINKSNKLRGIRV